MAEQEKLPDLLLEQLALGELPPEASRSLAIGPVEARQLETLKASDQAILGEHPPEQVAQAIRDRLAQVQPASQRWPALAWGLAGVAGVAAAVLVALAAWFAWPTPAPRPRPDRASVEQPGSERVKIEHGLLQVFRAQGQTAEQLSPGSQVKPGDRLQLRYNAMGERHGVILSVDGRGEVSLHFPESEDGSTALADRGIQSLAHSYVLDDAPGFERFFFVTGDQAIDVRALLTAARGIGPTGVLGLAPGLRQRAFLLRKPTDRDSRRTP